MKSQLFFVTDGVCTGCRKVIRHGPYFSRRIRRHLSDGYHNHDAVELHRWRTVRVERELKAGK